MKDEIWRDIEGYDGVYQISNLKRVRKTFILKSHLRKNRDFIYEAVCLNDIVKGINKLYKDAFNITKSKKKVNMILTEICNYFNITQAQIKGRSRKGQLPIARNIAMKILYENIKLSQSSIGVLFDNRTHSAVIFNIKSIDNLIFTEVKIKEQYQDVITILNL